MDYNDLLLLFVYFNRLIGKIIGNIKPECLQNKWETKWDNSSHITMEELVNHYIEHIKGHITHFKDRLNEIRK